MVPSLISSLPDWNVTTGSCISSSVTKVRVTTSDAFAKVLVVLLDSILVTLTVGATRSISTAVESVAPVT